MLYACIEGRFGIEYLLFEEIIIGTGLNLSRQDYEKCLKDPTRLSKTIDRLIPDYEKLQKFTSALMALDPQLPKLITWNPRDLMKSWGKLSEYLHWLGARGETTELSSWRQIAYVDVKQTLDPIWKKITSGQSGLMHPDNMNPEIREVWIDFKNGMTDLEGAKIRINILQPMLFERYT